MAVSLTSERVPAQRRPHVHELDRLRFETVVSVVIVHVLLFTTLAGQTALGAQIQYGFVAVFHFTRELFMFVTGFALVYVYFGKPFDWRYFWKRRGIGVLFPYVLWSVIYTFFYNQGHTWQWYLGTSLGNVISGSASYQLYYILMTLQFYLILPLFLWFLTHGRKRPWLALSISFALQAAILIAAFTFISGPTAIHTPFTSWLYTYQERFVLSYQFYFLLGGMAALHLDRVRAFLSKHGRWLIAAGACAFVANIAVYALYTIGQQMPPKTATTAFQPIVVVYTTGLLALLGYFAFRNVERSPAGADPRQPRSRWWALLADASFGIYLIHALILTEAQVWLIPAMKGLSPWIVLPVVGAFTVVVSTAATVALMHIPLLRRTVGRERTLHARGQSQSVVRRGTTRSEQVA